MRIVALTASPGEPSKTKALAELLVNELVAKLEPEIAVEVDWISVYELGADLALATDRESAGPVALSALTSVETADALVVATPIFRASYPGMFKHFMDLVDVYALANKPTFLVATGGSEKHMLVVDQVLRPLFGFFQALVAPVGIFAVSSDFDGTMLLNAEAYSRIEVAVADMLPLLRMRALT